MDGDVCIFLILHTRHTQPIRFSLHELVTDEMSVFMCCIVSNPSVLSDAIQKLDSHLVFLSLGFYY